MISRLATGSNMTRYDPTRWRQTFSFPASFTTSPEKGWIARRSMAAETRARSERGKRRNCFPAVLARTTRQAMFHVTPQDDAPLFHFRSAASNRFSFAGCRLDDANEFSETQELFVLTFRNENEIAFLGQLFRDGKSNHMPIVPRFFVTLQL